MSNFSVDVTTVDNLVPIPGADLIELAQIRGYQSVIKKGQFQIGDKVAYIPEASLLPPELIESLGLTGRLSGGAKNRVKAIKLRGCLSQGIIIPAKDEWNIGDDVSTILGIEKWEVEIPAHLRGNVQNANTRITMVYDIENIKNYPDLIQEGEIVVITEKLHGTNCTYSVLPVFDQFEKTYREVLVEGSYDRETKIETPAILSEEKTAHVDFFCASKGLSKQGLIFLLEQNKSNVYCSVARDLSIKEKMLQSPTTQFYLSQNIGPVHVIGEICGPGVQDLSYASSVTDKPDFRAFDIYVGYRGEGYFLGDAKLDEVLAEMNIPRVPVLYRGPFSKQILRELTDGKETVSGKELHIREGVVVKTAEERLANGYVAVSKKFDRGKIFDGLFDRVQLKSVSGEYLTRKAPDATEYQ